MRALFLDATRGVSALALLGALVDLGAAPSPVIRGVASMGLPIELRLEAGAAALSPPLAGVLVRPRDVTALVARAEMGEPARRLAADAMGRLLLAEAMRTPGARRFEVELEAAALVAFAGVAAALEGLGVERALASRIGVAEEPSSVVAELLGDWAEALDFGAGATDGEGAALLRALLGPTDIGLPEPPWRGTVARGRSRVGPPVAVALGDAS